MENRLARAGAYVDRDTVVGQPLACSDVGDELEHPLQLLGRELADLAERLDVALRQDEQVHRRLRVDVADRDEAVRGGDVVALAVEAAEETVVRQRGSPPPGRQRRGRRGARRVAAAHRAEDAVVARLQRYMQVAARGRRLAERVDELVVDVVDLDRGETKPLEARCRSCLPDEPGQAIAGGAVAIAAQVDAGEDDLAVTLRDATA